jgi:hypothetical protein
MEKMSDAKKACSTEIGKRLGPALPAADIVANHARTLDAKRPEQSEHIRRMPMRP